MATDQSLLNYTTLQDILNNYSSTDAWARFIMAARVLDRMCPLIRILPMVESNNVLSNIATRTDSLPVPGTRRFNEGVSPTASKNIPINDPTALYEDYSEVDVEQCRIQNDPTAWRMDQDSNHIEGLVQLLESTLWYGSLSQNPGAFNGLATRFNNLESYPNGDQSWQPNCWSTGSTTASSVTSAWIMEMGKDKVYGIYPANTMGGLSIEDLGEMTKEFATSTTGGPSLNKLMQVYRTHFKWWIGLQVADERCVQRVCNINPTALSSNNFDENIFIEALNWLPRQGDDPGTVIFVNRALKTQMDIRSVSQKLNTFFTQNVDTGDVWGTRVTRFQGIPVLVAEKLLSTETVLT
jgi:hypothetical protein